EPSNELGEYEVVEVDGSNEGTVRDLEAAVTGMAPLSAGGMQSLRENSKALRLVRAKSGEAAALLSVRTEPGGWGVIDLMLVREGADSVRRPLLDWSIAWLRNNGGRRTRTRVDVDDSAQLSALKDAGFTPGEIGLLFMRTVDKAEMDAKME